MTYLPNRSEQESYLHAALPLYQLQLTESWQPLLCIIHGNHEEHCNLVKRWVNRLLRSRFAEARYLRFKPRPFAGLAGFMCYLDDSIAEEKLEKCLQQEKRPLVVEIELNSKDWQRGGKQQLLPTVLRYWHDRAACWHTSQVHLQPCLIFLCICYQRPRHQHIADWFNSLEPPVLETEALDLYALGDRYDIHLPALVLPELKSIDREDAYCWARLPEVTRRFGHNIESQVMHLYNDYQQAHHAEVIPMLHLSDALYQLWKQQACLSPEGT